MSRNNKQQASFWRLVAMLPIIIIGFISTIGTGCGGGDDGSDSRFEEKELFSLEEVEVTAGTHTQFKLLGVNGEITITGESGADSVMITGTKRVHSKISAQDAKNHMQELGVDWQSLANEVSVKTIQPQDTLEQKYTIDYTITLPAFFTVQVDSINGIVTLDSIENDVTVKMVNAEVILMNIHGSAMVTIANGTIDSEVVLPLNGTIDLSSATGDIRLAIPVNTSATFSATALFGGINDSNLVFQNEVRTATSLSGTLGSGQGNISLETTGNISVSGL